MKLKVLVYNIFVLGVALISLTFLLFADLGEDKSRIPDAIMNFGHLPLFGVVALVLLWVLNKRRWPVTNIQYYTISFFAMLFLGMMTEFMQMLTPDRFFEITDIFYDAVGALTFLILAYPSLGNPLSKMNIYKKVSFFVIALAGLPIYLSVIDTWRMNSDIPLLGSFETRLEMDRWSASDSTFSRSKKQAAHGSYSLEAHLQPGQYPGIALEYLFEDWRGFDSFSFDVYLEGSNPLPVVVRINDLHHNQMFNDRFNRRFTLKPGRNSISISLDEVEKAPRTRSMDMSRIKNVCIFSYQLKDPRVLYFDHFRLVIFHSMER